jgi:hypothetical protein
MTRAALGRVGWYAGITLLITGLAVAVIYAWVPSDYVRAVGSGAYILINLGLLSLRIVRLVRWYVDLDEIHTRVEHLHQVIIELDDYVRENL